MLKFTALGYSTKEIATMLRLSKRTVDHHRETVYQIIKPQYNEPVFLAHYALAHGLIPNIYNPPKTNETQANIVTPKFRL